MSLSEQERTTTRFNKLTVLSEVEGRVVPTVNCRVRGPDRHKVEQTYLSVRSDTGDKTVRQECLTYRKLNKKEESFK